MGLTASSIVRYELVRFFRRRSTFWAATLTGFFLFAVLATEGAILIHLIGAHLAMGNIGQHGILNDLADIERTRYALLAVEIGILAVFAYLLAQHSVVDEVEDRSFALLLQTPLSVNRIILGKILGLSIALLVLHSIFMTVLNLPTPFMRRPSTTVLLEFLFVWLVAASYLPEGAASAMATLAKGRTYALFRLASLARIAGLFLLLEAAIPPELRHGGVHVWDVLVSYWNSNIALSSGEYLGLSTISPVRMVAIILGWQLFSGLLLWVFFVRGRVR